MTTTRTALLGLDKLWTRKSPPASAPKPTDKADRFSVKPGDIKEGMYLWARPKELRIFSESGTLYPNAIPGQRHVEATGKVKGKLVQVRWNNYTPWVQITDLAKPLQARTAAPAPKVATDIESQYNSGNLDTVLRLIVEGQDGKRTLKLNAKLRKAFAEMASIALDGVIGYRVGDKFVIDALWDDIIGSQNQKQVFATITKFQANRRQLAEMLTNPKTHAKGDNRAADHVLVAATLLAMSLRGSTEARADFLTKHLPMLVTRAGGSSLQTQMLTTLRQKYPYSEVKKMRTSRGLSASVRTAHADNVNGVLDKYAAFPMPKQGALPLDLLFTTLRSATPAIGWTQHIQNPADLVMIMTAPTLSSMHLGIEKSKQLLAFTESCRGWFRENTRLGMVYEPEGLEPLETYVARVASTFEGSDDLYVNANGFWAGRLVRADGRRVNDPKLQGVVHALARLAAVDTATTDEQRAFALTAAVFEIRKHKLMPDTVLSSKIRATFPWPVVEAMLRHRSGK